MQGYCRSYHCGKENSSLIFREFLTKEEKIEMLKDYKKALDKESEGVSERIQDLKREE